MNRLSSARRVYRRLLVSAPAFQLSLKRDDLWRVELGGAPLPIRCLRGALWITREDQPGDLVVPAGETCELEGHGLALVGAFSEAEIQVGSSVS